MTSALDQRIDAAMAELTAPGGAFALTEVTVEGRPLPMIADAPPTLPAFFARFCDQYADRECLVAGEERLSFGEVHATAERVAAHLAARIAPGDRVGIAMRNSPAWVVSYMAVLMAGGIATPLNKWWRASETAAALDKVGCRLVIADSDGAARLPPDVATITIDDRLPLGLAIAPIAEGPTASLPPITPENPATILFTSGSSGQPRGAVSDHRAKVQAALGYLLQGAALRIATAPARYPPAALLGVPLFHVTGEIALLLAGIAVGRKLVMMPRWYASDAMRLIEKERVTWFTGVPLMSHDILTHPDRSTYDLSSLTDLSGGGAPRPPAHVPAIAERVGIPPALGYGLTETNALGCSIARSNYLDKPASTGRPARLADVLILGTDGEPLPPRECGEIAIRSIANARGYWNDAAATDAAFVDGYLRTGDIGELDEDGYLFILGRAKDIIIRGGENVAPMEVEAALCAHPAVSEAAVFGAPDERWGEIPVAVLRTSSPLDPDALIAFLSERLAGFKLPARLYLLSDPLPRLGSGKVDKRTLREAYATLPLPSGAR